MAEFKNELKLRNGVRLQLDVHGNLHLTGASSVCTFSGEDLERLDNFLGEGIPAMKMAAAREAKVQDNQDRWYSMRIRPYRTGDNRIDGAVITLVDIDEDQRNLSRLEREEQVIEARVKSALEGFEQKVGTALQGRDAYFKQTFAVDPNFSRLQTHFDKYVQQGVPPEHAKRLAQLDAGMIGNGAPQGQPAAGAQGRSMPQAPRHLTTQPARAGGVPQPKGNVNFRDEKVRESRFNALAAKYGWES